MSLNHLSSPALAALGIVFSLFMSPVQAESRSPDGTLGENTKAARAPSRFTCGTLEFSQIVLDSVPRVNRSTSFVPLSNASVSVNVPANRTRCVKVVFTAETACSATASGDYCYIRALDNATVLRPGDGFQAIDSESPTAQGHSYEWVGRLSSGEHTISIETRVRDTPTGFYLDDWTLDVQVYDLPFGDGS